MKINESALFGGICDSDCEKMYKCLRAKTVGYCENETIYTYGESSLNIGIVLSGTVSLEKIDFDGNRTILDRLSSGDVFGETEVFAPATGDEIIVVCESKCAIVFIPRAAITQRCSKVCECHTRLLDNLLEMISNKAKRLSERVQILSNRTIRDKLMCFYMLEAAKQKSRKILLPFSVSMLADYICADRSAMMREIGNMNRDGLIESDRRRISLL
ncbi:MAG: Crp/Fnr family transcriptional regulator [Oscillospiraceae bacterium]